MLIAVACSDAGFAQDDDSGWATINAQRASCADVFVDNKYDMVVWVFARLFGVDCFGDCFGRQHVDALPRADVDTAFTHDAFGLIDVKKLLWLN